MKELLFIAFFGLLLFGFMKLVVLTPPQENTIEVGRCYQQRGYSDKLVVTNKMKFGFKYRINNVIGYIRYNQYDLVEMDCYD